MRPTSPIPRKAEGAAPSWWDGATVEQKLAQLDGGIECGMTALQIAMACGIPATQYGRSMIISFGYTHSRALPRKRTAKVMSRGMRSTSHRRAEYFQAGAPDFWNDNAGASTSPDAETAELEL